MSTEAGQGQFGLFEIVGFALGAAGVPRASKEEIARAYLGGTSGTAWLGQDLAVLSALCFLVFAARLRDALRADDGLDWLSTAALTGGVLFATGEVMGVGAYGAIRARADSGLDAGEAVSLADLGQALVVLAVAGLGLFLLGACHLVNHIVGCRDELAEIPRRHVAGRFLTQTTRIQAVADPRKLRQLGPLSP